MAFLRLYCGFCRGRWEVYERDNWKSQAAATCPHCGKRIDGETWAKQVVPAFCAVGDANRELYKDSTGYHIPYFRFDVLSDKIGG